MTPPPIRLAFGALFWRAFAVLFVLGELAVWSHLRPFLGNRAPGFRVAALILYSPRMIFRVFLIAAAFTVLIDLYVRFIMRPLLARWYSPRTPSTEFGTPIAFHLESREQILNEVPSRRVVGRRCVPGTLIRTDRRLWFSPHAWDCEPWSLRETNLDSLTTRSRRSRLGTFLIGTPDRLVLVDDRGEESVFVVADPGEILSWYPDRADGPQDAYEPSALQLL